MNKSFPDGSSPSVVSTPARRIRQRVVGGLIDVVTWNQVLETLGRWSDRRESRVVCVCNAHSTVTAWLEPDFRRVIDEADLSVPDGMPVSWLMRLKGHHRQGRINGPDLMTLYCAQAAGNGQSIFLYGGTPQTLEVLSEQLRLRFPGLTIAGMYSPPFRDLTPAEDEEAVDLINASGAGMVFVSLGCPKQERWMANHHGRVQAVMVGVGAAFDYLAGLRSRAPLWMQRTGLEWLYRLAAEPRRLWRRYLVTNSLFVVGAATQLLGGLDNSSKPAPKQAPQHHGNHDPRHWGAESKH